MNFIFNLRKKTFNIVYRKYVLSYSSVLFDFDVTMIAKLQQINKALVVQNISYSGYWDIPFRRPEIVSFNIRFYDFVVAD